MNNIALLIPHYNNPFGLIKSLESIDSTENIDVYIVDDGSENNKVIRADTLNAFKAKGKVFLIYLDKNIGIENALNFGIKAIVEKKSYKYIARLDCGDLCIGKRFKIQEDFFNQNAEVFLIGSNAIAIDQFQNELYKSIFPYTHDEIKQKMYVNSMFLHPTVMFKIEIIEKIGYYPTNYIAAEDYAFFFKILNKFETANIQSYLVKYEINPAGISLSKRKLQVKNRLRIISENFYFGFWPIYGLIRNLILYMVPNVVILKLKKQLK